jgi:FHS family glucose/mannose:H+ symporter-like MFS transporter
VADSHARRPLFFAASGGLVLFGIVLALLGTLFGLPEMRARLHVNLGQQGDLFLLLYFGVLVASVLVGPLIDRIGNKAVLLVSAVLVTVALGGFAAAESFAAAAVSGFVLGVGGGALNIAANVLVSDLYGDERGPMLNLLGLFYGIGALLLPLLAASISALLTIRQLLICAAMLAALTAAAYALLRFPPAREAHGFSARQVAQVARYPGILLLAFLLFCQSGNEASIGGWTSTYAGALGAGARRATWVLTGYWAAMMAGRLLAARLLRRLGKAQLVFASSAGSVAGCAVLLLAHSVAALAAGVALLGLSFAAVYPTTLAIAGDRYPRFSGTVFGLLFSVGIVGGMTFPWVIGHLGESYGMRLPMALPLVSATMICALVTVFRSRERNG